MMMKHHQHDGPSTSPSSILTHQGEEKSAPKGSDSTWLHRRIMGPDHNNRYMEYWLEVKQQLHLAGPMILVNLSQIGFQIISCMIVGHLGELALSSCSIATSMANVTGFCFMKMGILSGLTLWFFTRLRTQRGDSLVLDPSVFVHLEDVVNAAILILGRNQQKIKSDTLGIASSLETLCGQAYGAKQYEMVGIYLQRGLFVLHATAIPLSFVYGYMGQILAGLGQNKVISYEAGKYARWLIPTLFAQASAQPLIRFLQTQSLVYPMMLSSAVSVVCHAPLCWFLVYKTSLGFEGAAISTSICNWINVIFLFIYVGFSPSCQRTRAPLTWKALHGMRSFLYLAFPSTAMVCLEWWCYEFLVLLSGLLPNPELETSTLATCLNLANVTFQMGFGLAASVSTRVSNELGAGRPQATRDAICVGMFLTISQACIVSFLYLCFRNVLGRAFSSDVEVIQNVAILIKLLAISSFLDSTQGVLSGIARGCGWQTVGAFINLGSFYIVGLPVSCILGFLLELGVQGLWIGVICAPVVQIILLGFMTWTANWSNEIIKAQKRMESSNLETSLLLQ